MEIGKDFNVVTVSIDPTDRPVIAEAKQAMYAGMYGRPGAQYGWHFLTGDEPQIKQLASAVGFRYAYDPDSKQYAHASAIMLLTPDGKLSRYFYGVTYPERDLRLGLVEASQGKIGSPVDQILLFCYHYDPHTGKYGLLISRVIQLGGTRNRPDRRDFSDSAFPGRALRASRTQGVDRARRVRRVCKGSQRNGDDGLPPIRI